MNPIRRLTTNIILLLGLAIFGSLAGWLAYRASCLAWWWPLCRNDAGDGIVILGILALVLAWLALLLRERLRRRVTRGMYARVAGVRGRESDVTMARVFESVAKVVIEGKWDNLGRVREGEDRHPLDLPDNYGWLVPLEDGSAVRVYVDELYKIINDAWNFQADPQNKLRAPLGQRRLDPMVGRSKTLAVNYLVDLAGGVRSNKATANSTRRITRTPWTIMQSLMDVWPPGEIG